MADIVYTPQFQPPAWRDNVDLVAAEGPRGFNTQFQSLSTELTTLSTVVKQLSDAINTINATLTQVQQTANTASATATAANNAATAASTAATTANTAASTANTTANDAQKALRAIRWGYVSGNGSVMAGSGGFNLNQVSPGLWDITFNPPFSAAPAVQVMLDPYGDINASPSGLGYTATVITGIDSTRCRVQFGQDTTSTGQEVGYTVMAFTFLAYGPA